MKNRLFEFACGTSALLCVILLFVGDGGDTSRSANYLWDSGHLLAFGLWTYLLVHHWHLPVPHWHLPVLNWHNLSFRSLRYRVTLTIIAAALLSFVIEYAQSRIGRTFSYADIGKNMVGCIAGLVFFLPMRRQPPNRLRNLLKIGIVVLILVELTPLAKAIVDETLASSQFPMLSSLESPLEIDRWSGNAHFAIDETVKMEGHASLRVELGTQQYSGAGLKYFPCDWRGYGALQFDLLNPDDDPISLACRIHDVAHDKNGFGYNDRFNQRILLNTGWHRIKIKIDDIKNAPANRIMNLSEIRGFMIFSTQLGITRTIYIDAVQLIP